MIEEIVYVEARPKALPRAKQYLLMVGGKSKQYSDSPFTLEKVADRTPSCDVVVWGPEDPDKGNCRSLWSIRTGGRWLLRSPAASTPAEARQLYEKLEGAQDSFVAASDFCYQLFEHLALQSYLELADVEAIVNEVTK